MPSTRLIIYSTPSGIRRLAYSSGIYISRKLVNSLGYSSTSLSTPKDRILIVNTCLESSRLRRNLATSRYLTVYVPTS